MAVRLVKHCLTYRYEAGTLAQAVSRPAPSLSPSMSSTARDVARAANVALPTAYEALRGSGRLADATRERVLTAARELGYKPSAAARVLNGGGTRQLGMLGKLHPANADIFLGGNAAALEKDYLVSLLTYEDKTLDRMQSRAFRERIVDGMVVVDGVPDGVLDELAAVEHCVRANFYRCESFDCVQRPELEVGRLAGRALAEAGWRDFTFVHGPLDGDHHSHRDRLRGLREVAAEVEGIVRTVGFEKIGTSWKQLDAAIGRDLTDSAFVFSDTYRVRAMQTLLMHRGLLAGREVAMVCCDDTNDFRFSWPELSRASFDRTGMGRMAVEMLLERIASGTPVPSRTVAVRWIEGETVALHPSSAGSSS